MHVRQKCCQRFTPRAISLSLNFNRNGIIYEEYRRHEFSLSSALHPLRRHAKGNGSMAFPVGRLHGSWLLRLPLSNPPRSTSSPGELPGLRSLLFPTTRGFRATRTVIGGLRISGKRFHFLFLFDHNPPRDALELIIQGAEQEEQRTGEQSSMTDRDRQTEDSRPSWSSNDGRRNSNNRGSDEEGSDLLMVEEAKDMLRDVLTMCEQEPQKTQLAKEREKAQGNPRAMMLSVVPTVVAIAEEALGKRLEHHPSIRARLTAEAKKAGASLSTRPMGSRACLGSGPLLLLGFLEEAKLLVGTDPSGVMKRDMRSLRELLSAPL